MNATAVAVIVMSSLSLVASVSTLAVVVIGGKRVKTQVDAKVDETKQTANETIQKVADVLRGVAL